MRITIWEVLSNSQLQFQNSQTHIAVQCIVNNERNKIENIDLNFAVFFLSIPARKFREADRELA